MHLSSAGACIITYVYRQHNYVLKQGSPRMV